MRWLLITTIGKNPGDEWIRIGIQNVIREVDPDREYILLDKESPSMRKTQVEFDKCIWCGMPVFWSQGENQNCRISWWQELMLNWPSERKNDFMVLGAGSFFPWGSELETVSDRQQLIQSAQDVLQRSFCVTARDEIVPRVTEMPIPHIVCPAVFSVLDCRKSHELKLANIMPNGAHYTSFGPQEAVIWNEKKHRISNILRNNGFVFVAHSLAELQFAQKCGWEKIIPYNGDPYGLLEYYGRCGKYFGNRVHGAIVARGNDADTWSVGYDSRQEAVRLSGARVSRPSELDINEIEDWTRRDIKIEPFDMKSNFEKLVEIVRKFALVGNTDDLISPQSKELIKNGHPKISNKKVKRFCVAEDYVKTGIKVDEESSFGTAIQKLFTKIRPKKIIETGTYLGTGTTTIIAKSLEALGIKAIFYTIEVNPQNYAQAKEYFKKKNINVHALNGLSVPRSILPSKKEIVSKTITDADYDGIFVDHKEERRVELYYNETNFPDVPDNLLYLCLKSFDYRPDFVLLDSGGHIGNIEFNHLVEHLQDPCYIALDDIYHVKHHKSFRQIQTDPRFKLVMASKEKFGFCIAKFTPTEAATEIEKNESFGNKSKEARKVLIVRPDSIGDFVIFSGILEHFREIYKDSRIHILVQEHIAELAQNCPYIDEVITYDRKKLVHDQDYPDGIIEELKSKKFDVAIYPVYSRDEVGDFLTLNSGADTKIASEGDESNMPPDKKLANDSIYTRLIPASDKPMLETVRNVEFINNLALRNICEQCAPKVWIQREDETKIDELLSNLNVENPLVICPFGNNSIRHWPGYKWAQLISNYQDNSILVCGATQDHNLAENILRQTNHPNIHNLCGKISLRQLAALLKRARLCVGVESAAGHLATAAHCAHVIIIGGGHFGRFMPYSPDTTLVYLPMSCYHCNWRCKYGQARCITQIRVETAYMAVRQALDGSGARRSEPLLIEETLKSDFVPIKPAQFNSKPLADVDISEIDKDSKYLVTAIVSTYNAERFIVGCLDDLEQQTIADKLEIIVVNSGSQENEEAIVREYQQKYN